MRIGEILVSAGLLTEQQLDEALRAQVMWGGRLGTNLAELKHVNLDQVSGALGRQFGLPAALGAHFVRADPELQQMLPRELAALYECVPLMRAGRRIVIASIKPLDDRAVAMVAGQLDINRKMIVQSIAAEMRIRFHLERIYDIPRDQRFLRTRRVTEQSAVFSVPDVINPDREPSYVGAIPEAIDDPALVVEPETATGYDPSLERRTYLSTLADLLKSHPDADSVVARVERVTPRPRSSPLATGAAAPRLDGAPIPDSLSEALVGIELARDRDELAHRVIGTVDKFVPESRAGLLLVVRGDAAVSWTGFCRDGTELPALAVPLDHPGLCSSVKNRRAPRRGASGDLGAIDYLLLASLGVQFGDLVVTPISIAEHVIGMVVVAAERQVRVSNLDAITSATGAAFTRLMRNAST